jgi:hypothetical protein
MAGEHHVAETVARATGATARDRRAKAVASIATGRFSAPEKVAT